MNKLALATVETFRNQIIHTDLLTLCRSLPPQSVDMILADLPYGTTACSWDEIIPFESMWKAFRMVIKPRGAIVLTSSQPFTTKLNMSNFEWYRYEIIIEKDGATGFLNANRQPLKAHEVVSIFYGGQPTFNPQMQLGKPYRATRGAAGGHIQDKTIGGYQTINTGLRYPRSVMKFNWPHNPVHPTEKPIELFKYLIRTFSNANDIILDPCVGSGTTAVAARNVGRDFICGDITEDYVRIARERLDRATFDKPIPVASGLFQRTIFEMAGG